MNMAQSCEAHVKVTDCLVPQAKPSICNKKQSRVAIMLFATLISVKADAAHSLLLLKLTLSESAGATRLVARVKVNPKIR